MFGISTFVIASVFAIIGHIFPFYTGFKGGKGILSGFFVAITVDWRIAVLILAVFAVAYLSTQYVSLGSVLASITFGVGFVIFHHDNWIVMLCGVLMAVLATFMHRENIVRLLKKQKSRLLRSTNPIKNLQNRNKLFSSKIIMEVNYV